MNQTVNLTFSLKYLVNFAKSSSLSNVVQLMLSNDVPLLVVPPVAATSAGASPDMPPSPNANSMLQHPSVRPPLRHRVSAPQRSRVAA